MPNNELLAYLLSYSEMFFKDCYDVSQGKPPQHDIGYYKTKIRFVLRKLNECGIDAFEESLEEINYEDISKAVNFI